MPRALRAYEPGAIYHLTAHGVDDRPIFHDDADRWSFVALVTRAQRACAWRFYAICLMDTHYHLVLSSSDGEISAGMRNLNGRHSRLFNARHGRRGALFESRYRERRIQDDRHLLEAIRYVAMNPVRAGMSSDPRTGPGVRIGSSWDSSPRGRASHRCSCSPTSAAPVLRQSTASGRSWRKL